MRGEKERSSGPPELQILQPFAELIAAATPVVAVLALMAPTRSDRRLATDVAVPTPSMFVPLILRSPAAVAARLVTLVPPTPATASLAANPLTLVCSAALFEVTEMARPSVTVRR